MFFKTGHYYRILNTIGRSKIFKKGVVVRAEQDANARIEYVTILGEAEKRYISADYLYSTNAVELTEGEIDLMNKPQNILIINSTGVFGNFPNMDKANEAIQLALQKNPAGQYNVYELKGAIRAKEVPIEFISTSAL